MGHISNDGSEKEKMLNRLLLKDPFITTCQEAPSFYPTKEEFDFPMAYLNKIKPHFEKFGMCKIVPPEEYALDTTKVRKSFTFSTKQQNIHQLQYRSPQKVWNVMQQRTSGSDVFMEGNLDESFEYKESEKTKLLNAFRDHLKKFFESKDEAAKPKLKSDDNAAPNRRKRKRENSSDSAVTPEKKRRKLYSPFSIKDKMDEKNFGFPRLQHLYNLKTYNSMANDFENKFFDGKFLEESSKSLLPKPMLRKLARNPFRRICDVSYCDSVDDANYHDVVQEYWKIVERTEPTVSVQYGSDLDAAVVGSLFPRGWDHGWNMNRLAIEKDSMLHYLHQKIPGINSPMVYVGMMFSSFCWHTEDNYLPATNYIHHGAPKTWYAIPSHAAIAFETAMRKELGPLFKEHPNLIHGMITQFSPRLIQRHGVPIYTINHEPGTFVVTLPRVYHAGFNHGFNIAESVNLAPSCWVPYSRIASQNYRRCYRSTAYSHDKIFLNAVKNLIEFDKYSGEAILTEVKKIVEDETKYRRDVKAQGIVIQKMLDGSRNSSRFCKTVSEADMQFCAVCKQDCYLTSLVCLKCPKVQSLSSKKMVDKTVCLWHQHDCKCPNSSKKLLVRFTLEELEDLYCQGMELSKQIIF